MPWVKDGHDRMVEQAYLAWPLRLVIIDNGGRIALDMGHGFGGGRWDLKQVETWLNAHGG
jgi:hypothetical protein